MPRVCSSSWRFWFFLLFLPSLACWHKEVLNKRATRVSLFSLSADTCSMTELVQISIVYLSIPNCRAKGRDRAAALTVKAVVIRRSVSPRVLEPPLEGRLGTHWILIFTSPLPPPSLPRSARLSSSYHELSGKARYCDERGGGIDATRQRSPRRQAGKCQHRLKTS